MRDSDDDILKERIKELEKLNSEYQKRENLSFKLSQLKQELLTSRNLEEKLKLITDGVVTIFKADFARICWLKMVIFVIRDVFMPVLQRDLMYVRTDHHVCI